MRAASGAALGAALVLAAGGNGARAGWQLQSSASVQAEYDSNVRRVAGAETSDVVSRLGLALGTRHVGPRHRFDAGYNPTYGTFLDNGELDDLSHLVRVGWSLNGARSSLQLDGNYGYTQDPRLVAVEADEDAAPAAPEGTEFLVQRSQVSQVGVRGAGQFGLSRTLDLRWNADHNRVHYSRANLVDSENLGTGLEVAGSSGRRTSWLAGYRYSRFDGGGRSSGFHAAQAGGTFQLLSSLQLAVTGALPFANQGGLDAGLFGSITLSGDHRRLGWSVSYGSSYSAGGGAAAATQNWTAATRFDVQLARRDRLSLAATRSASSDARQGDVTSPRADIDTDRYQLTYERSVGQRWSVQVAAMHLDQGQGGGGAVGTAGESPVGRFDEQRLTVGVTYALGRGT